jgi:hypothetical protein
MQLFIKFIFNYFKIVTNKEIRNNINIKILKYNIYKK